MPNDLAVIVNAEQEAVIPWDGAGDIDTSLGTLDPSSKWFPPYVVHQGCRGFVDRKTDVSPTHNIFSCRSCYLRFAVPKTVPLTWVSLRAFFSSDTRNLVQP